jgi:hypothetical protein
MTHFVVFLWLEGGDGEGRYGFGLLLSWGRWGLLGCAATAVEHHAVGTTAGYYICACFCGVASRPQLPS